MSVLEQSQKCDILQWSVDNWSQRVCLEVTTWQSQLDHLIITPAIC